jgi:hypothetical protein
MLTTAMPINLYLYSTSHCHLCEVAHALILQVLKTPKLKIVEITDEEQLLVRYGLKIPVLQRQDTLAELNWPFSEADIAEFVT